MQRPTKTRERNARPVYNATEARNAFSELLEEAFYRGPVFVKRRKKVAVLISQEDYDRLIALETEKDIEDAQAALEDFKARGGISMNELMKDLGIDETL